MSIFEQLSAPFPADRVSWRVGSTTQDKSKGMALAYIDARDVMDRLDSVVGPGKWQCRYPHANGKTVCEIGLHIDGEWVWKADGAGDTDYEAEKGALSDAFKRAAVRWGIGRYLYDLDSPWVAVEQRGKSFVIKEAEYPRLQKVLVKKQPAALSSTSPVDVSKDESFVKLEDEITDCQTLADLDAVMRSRKSEIDRLSEEDKAELRRVYAFKKEALKKFGEAA